MERSEERLLDTKEAAEYLGFHYNTLEKLRSTGGGPPFRKLGRSVRYHIKDLEAWSDARCCKSTFDEAYLLLSSPTSNSPQNQGEK